MLDAAFSDDELGAAQCPDETDVCYAAVDPLEPPIEAQQMATGDFDGDGTADLAIVDDNGDIFLLLNDDATEPGSLSEEDLANDFTRAPAAIAAGDFDGDGTSEVAGVIQSDNVIQVRGQAIASFQEDVNFPYGIIVADFNGDTRDDAAVVGSDRNVVVLFGQTGGGFNALRSVLDTTDNVQDFAAGDFDNDDDMDIAVITKFPDVMFQVFENDGGGNFTPRSPFIPCSGDCPPGGDQEDLQALVVGDFDGDGDDDVTLQVACFNNCDTDYDRIRFFTAEGINGFQGVRTWELDGGGDQLRGADMDADGSFDIVWQHRFQRLNLFVLYRDYFTTSDGPPASLNVREVSIDTVLVDLNDDNFADIATVTNSNTVDVILSD